ncbi:enoyl-CoA hydratase-related protein [Roseospira goensis]|uniref:Enoyl-CoA hydratase/carnithine racemase n=1 Tax=Roseospira goensis TaxID=391922 RepID=A0A7W6RWX6_9PROT|nr:enoyl-CoA hydratase-related protein [Roseospira goensis]MBB4284721.1 enoyl-CoA hydratase/carnithine racemase [Roseospira goensis]
MTDPAVPALTDALLSVDGRVATLTLNRDDVRNALTGSALVDDIVAVVDWINAGADVSVLVVTGAGTAFSSGGNVKDMRDGAPPFGGPVEQVARQYRHGIQRLPLALDGLEVPAIAAVNGPAIGAGCDLACMCDLRIAGQSAVFGETFVNLGIIPGDGGAWFLQRLIGPAAAADMTFTGRLVKADEALALGLVSRVVPDADLVATAAAMAAEIAAKPPLTVRHTKRLMKMAQRTALPDFLAHCAAVQGMCHTSADHAEAVAAFLEKRPPTYGGR